MDLRCKVRAFSLKHNLLARGDSVLIAVSGGPDSVALLHLLYGLRKDFALRLEVAHVEHGMRGDEAKSDAVFVQDWAERLDLPLHMKAMSIPALRAKTGKGNLEELGRRERYRFFADVAKQRNLNRIATAHTLNDQAETVLMWLLRGAGPKGLGGIAPCQTLEVAAGEWSKPPTLIRPLLGVAKEPLLEFLRQKNLSYCVDRTNEDSAYLRNWLRLEVLPRLKERIDERLPLRLAQLAELFRDEADYLNKRAQEELDVLSANTGLSRERFLCLPKAMQREVLRLWIKQARGHLRGIDFDHAEAALDLINQGPAQSRVSIPGGWELVRAYDNLRLARSVQNRLSPRYAYPLRVDTLLAVPEAGMTISCRRLTGSACELPAGPSEAIFDVAALAASLVVRNFRPGDRFQPFGMAGHKKVKDLFIEKKVPRSTRALLPLLVMGREVLWLPGYGRSDIGRVGPGVKEILRFSVISDENCS
jgi:tRNA(Ile)-lysidine synthase